MPKVVVIELENLCGFKIKLEGISVQQVPNLQTAKNRATTLALNAGEEVYEIHFFNGLVETVNL